MRAYARRLALLAAAAAAGRGCRRRARPLQIGVVVDCVGIYRSLEDAELSGAALPLLERGAELRGQRAADGLTPRKVAGRAVELVPGCTESWEFSTLDHRVRQLTEVEHVDAIVAGGRAPTRSCCAKSPQIPAGRLRRGRQRRRAR